MSSPNDNIQMKDGNDSPFKMRTKDVSVAQDGSLQVVRHLSTDYPVDYGVAGCYSVAVGNTGSMSAGLASSSPIFAFRNPSPTLLALIRSVRLSAYSLSTGFDAGFAHFPLKVARSFTAMDTGGSSGGSGKALRTTMGASACEMQIASTGALTPGTRTLDTAPLEGLFGVAVTTEVNTPFVAPRTALFSAVGSEHPLVLAQNEGFIISASVPATGIWAFVVTAQWDEVPINNY